MSSSTGPGCSTVTAVAGKGRQWGAEGTRSRLGVPPTPPDKEARPSGTARPYQGEVTGLAPPQWLPPYLWPLSRRPTPELPD